MLVTRRVQYGRKSTHVGPSTQFFFSSLGLLLDLLIIGNKLNIKVLMYQYIYYLLNNEILLKLSGINIDNECKDIYGEFCTLEIQKHIEDNIKYIHEYQSIYKNNKIRLIVGTKNKNVEINIDNIFKSINLILEISKASNKNILIKYWDTDLKKYFNKKCESIGSSQVNTAVTKFYDNFSINIWRREELIKVILHELMHFLGLDFHEYPDEINQFIYKTLNVSKEHELRIYEAYVETWATILHLIYLIKYSDILKKKKFQRNI